MFAPGKTAGAVSAATYIEDVFSTYLYTGAASVAQTITNNIDMSTYGGMLWIKSRSNAVDNCITSTAQGITNDLATNTTNGISAAYGSVTSVSTSGFSLAAGKANANSNGYTYASWAFRKQPKFFDIVTFTGDGTNSRVLSHSLNSVPGCIIVKATSTTSDWYVYHRSLGTFKTLLLNSSAVAATRDDFTGAPTSTTFQVGDAGTGAGINLSGVTYVAYLFAHDAGGFGLTGTDNVISCGSFSGSGTQTINLGYEPQWVMVKRTVSTSGPWYIADNMRGFPASTSATVNYLKADSSGAEVTYTNDLLLNATGFTTPGFSNQTCIYIAIRRGPMKVPTDATKVFSPIASAAAGGTALTTNFPVDLQMYGVRAGDGANTTTSDRLRGVSTTSTAGGYFIVTSSTAAETGGSYTLKWGNTGFVMPAGIGSQDGIFWNFQRAPKFFDEVCYTGTGSATTFSHNLGAAPEMMITKSRSGVINWNVYHSAVGVTKAMVLNTSAAPTTATSFWNDTAPTSSVFTVGTANGTNSSGNTYVAYLFATCAGVSKVGSYTGTATLTTINCGFTGGARFVLIKRTDTSSNWFVWDTARGMVAGTDPSLALNSTAAESSANSVYTITTGFQLLASPSADVNANGGTYIYLAIA